MNDAYHFLMQGKFYIYTEDFFLLPRWKNSIKSLLGKVRGPEAVLDSLIKGLNELGVGYCVNYRHPPNDIVACVLSGAETLKWAIAQKQTGKIEKIIAGPNIVITPNDRQGLLKHPLIDKIIVPSQWVKEFYSLLAPEISSKIRIWAAGVEVPESFDERKEFDFLVFNKIQPQSLFVQVSDFLTAQNPQFQIIDYGNFGQTDYFNLLKQSKNLIYLSASESQGLALFEAWARNVPALVWEPGVFKYSGVEVSGKIAAPYLSMAAGESFKDIDEFKRILPKFLNSGFSPRQYVLENFTNKICARKYLDIINV